MTRVAASWFSCLPPAPPGVGGSAGRRTHDAALFEEDIVERSGHVANGSRQALLASWTPGQAEALASIPGQSRAHRAHPGRGRVHGRGQMLARTPLSAGAAHLPGHLKRMGEASAWATPSAGYPRYGGRLWNVPGGNVPRQRGAARRARAAGPVSGLLVHDPLVRRAPRGQDPQLPLRRLRASCPGRLGHHMWRRACRGAGSARNCCASSRANRGARNSCPFIHDVRELVERNAASASRTGKAAPGVRQAQADVGPAFPGEKGHRAANREPYIPPPRQGRQHPDPAPGGAAWSPRRARAARLLGRGVGASARGSGLPWIATTTCACRPATNPTPCGGSG